MWLIKNLNKNIIKWYIPDKGGVDECKEAFETFGEELLPEWTILLSWRLKSPLELAIAADDDKGEDEFEVVMCESPPIAGDTYFCGLIVTEDEEIVVLLSNVFRYEFSASKFSFNSFILRYSYLSAADSICFSSANCFNVKSLSSNFVCLPISKSYKRLKRSISFCSSLIFDCDSYL